MGMTMAEKILAGHAGKSRVEPGEYVWGKVDETNFMGQQDTLDLLDRLGIEKLFDPERIYVTLDHSSPPSDLDAAEQAKRMRQFVKKYGITHWYEIGRHGIQHQLFPEEGYVRPGELICMADSHSTTYGAFNAASCASNIEAVFVAITGKLWFKVPPSIKFNLVGKLGPMVVGKDIMLRIAGLYGTDIALYKSAEYLGPVAKQLSLASRMTLSNMGVEIGAKFAMFEADEKVYEFLEGRTDIPYTPVSPDPDAVYEAEYTIDVTDMPPMVACPHDPSNVHPVTEVEEQNVKIDQAFLGSCTNGRMEDLRMAAQVLKGRTIHPDVRMLISPASMNVWREALDEGLFEIFHDAGATVMHSTCGPCMGTHMGILGSGERAISSSNRNFKGRMGNPNSEVYLSNAAVVAAAAVEGRIVDPRKYL